MVAMKLVGSSSEDAVVMRIVSRRVKSHVNEWPVVLPAIARGENELELTAHTAVNLALVLDEEQLCTALRRLHEKCFEDGTLPDTFEDIAR